MSNDAHQHYQCEDFAAADGLKLAYYVDDFTDPWRTPDTLLLLHAAMGSALRWFNWVPRLARRYRVMRLDLRGHGNSAVPAPEQPFSLAHLVGDVLQLLDLAGGRERAHRRQLGWRLRGPASRDPPPRARQNAGAFRLDARLEAQPCADLDSEDRRGGAEALPGRHHRRALRSECRSRARRVVHRAGRLQRSGLYWPLRACTCARTTSWRTSTRYARRR